MIASEKGLEVLMENYIFTADSIPRELYPEYEGLLSRCGLRDEHDGEFYALCTDEDGKLLAAGSRRGNVLKQICVLPEAEGLGLCAEIVTELIQNEAEQGETHLFLYTSPDHEAIFDSLGFSPIISTGSMLMMENYRGGFETWLSSLPRFDGKVGAVVCNCNPFTLGHRHLIRTAAARCDKLLVFVLSEDLSMFSTDVRFELVKAGTRDISNVYVLESHDYIISRATFPTYFIKEQAVCTEAACELDVAIFAEKIAPALNIAVRFVGQEPFDQVTRAYNEKLKAVLPSYGIEVTELPRYMDISAAKVRRLINEGRLEEARAMLPETTYEYCKSHFRTGAELQG